MVPTLIMSTWLEDVQTALKNLGGEAHLSKIFEEVKRVRKNLNPSWTRTVQKELERHSSDSSVWNSKYKGKEDLFYSAKGIGEGVWGLRNYNHRTIRNMLFKLATEYNGAKKLGLKNNPFLKYIRKEIPKAFSERAGSTISGYKVGVVQGLGAWARVPWINLMDPRVTTTANKGYYPVYLVHENGKKILFVLAQGTYSVSGQYKGKAKEMLKYRAIILRNKLNNFSKYGFKQVSKKVTIGKDPLRDKWVESGAFGKWYTLSNLPNESELLKDLKNMVKLYKLAIEKGGIIESTHAIDFEDEEVEKSLKGIEKKVVRFHREKEKTYIKTDPALIKRLKKKYKYTCQACNLKFDKIYGDYSDKKDYIEAHHLIPKSEILRKMKPGDELRRDESDFAILCANCHRMIHKYACPPLNEFKEKVIKQYKDFLKDK